MVVERGFRNSSSCGVENKLKAIKLTARKIEKERVTISGVRFQYFALRFGCLKNRGFGLVSVFSSQRQRLSVQ